MSKALEWTFSLLFITFVTVFFVCLINFSVAIEKVNNYHYATVHEIESSDFSPYVISEREANAEYPTVITEKSSKEDLRIYEVKTSTTLSIPIFGYSTEYVKVSTAR